MSKKLLVTLLVAGLMLAAVPIVLGATDNSKLADIAKLQQQIFDLRKQLVQKYVENGQITQEQGTFMQNRMEQMYQYQQQNGFQPGFGCGGMGPGGRGFGPGGRGSGWGQGAVTPPQGANPS